MPNLNLLNRTPKVEPGILPPENLHYNPAIGNFTDAAGNAHTLTAEEQTTALEHNDSWAVIQDLHNAETNFSQQQIDSIASAQTALDDKITELAGHNVERNLRFLTVKNGSRRKTKAAEAEVQEARDVLQEALKTAYVDNGVGEELFSLEKSDDEAKERARGVLDVLRFLSAEQDVEKLTESMTDYAEDKFNNVATQTPQTGGNFVKRGFNWAKGKLGKAGAKAVDAYTWASERDDDGSRKWGRSITKAVGIAGIAAAAGVSAGFVGAGAAAAGVAYVSKKVINSGFMGAVKKRDLRENIDRRIADINQESREALRATLHGSGNFDTAEGIAATRKMVNKNTRKNRAEMGGATALTLAMGGLATEFIGDFGLGSKIIKPFTWAANKVSNLPDGGIPEAIGGVVRGGREQVDFIPGIGVDADDAPAEVGDEAQEPDAPAEVGDEAQEPDAPDTEPGTPTYSEAPLPAETDFVETLPVDDVDTDGSGDLDIAEITEAAEQMGLNVEPEPVAAEAVTFESQPNEWTHVDPETGTVTFDIPEGARWQEGSPTLWGTAESLGIPNDQITTFLQEATGDPNIIEAARFLQPGETVTFNPGVVAEYQNRLLEEAMRLADEATEDVAA